MWLDFLDKNKKQYLSVLLIGLNPIWAQKTDTLIEYFIKLWMSHIIWIMWLDFLDKNKKQYLSVLLIGLNPIWAQKTDTLIEYFIKLWMRVYLCVII